MEENGDMHERLVLAPMVKAAVLAMNATDDILHQENCGGISSTTKCRPADVRYESYGMSYTVFKTQWLTILKC